MSAPARRAATRIVFATVFIDLIGFGIVLPLLPIYARRFEESAALIGLLVASDSLMQFVAAPLWGRASDRFGRRPVLLIGLLGSTLSYTMFGLAGSFLALLASRVVAGASGGTAGVAQAYLADLTPPEERAQAMGLIGAAYGLGFIVGPALGGIASQWGDAAPGLLAAALAGTNCLFAWFMLPETRPRASARPAAAVRWEGLVRPLAVMFATTLAFTVMYVVFPLFCDRVLGLPRARVSYLYVFIGVVSALVQGWLIRRLSPRLGERTMAVAGALALAAGFALVPLAGASGVAGMLGALLLVAAGFGFVGPSVTGWVSRATPADDQGRALGLLQSAGAIARIAGPPAAGAIYQAAGSRAPFVVAAVVAGMAAGLATLLGAAPSLRRGEEPGPAD